MKTLLAILSILLVALALPVAAKKGKGPHEGPELKIVEVNAVTIKVSLGNSGDQHVIYKISDQTKVTLNGSSVPARDLKPGMVARIEAGSDSVAISITAKDAPTHPARHRVG